MSYKVLYRKYRPTSFKQIIGENTIIDSLKESIINKNFSHAYIFTGPRGTGKTSTAKVLAKTINCTNNENGEPCGKCASCLNFDTSPDIIEIDAASNNGVDEIRELRNNITLAPSSSNYKIYIIDEVHMLSSGAFNALLKTLEEPPSHAIFILATTEIYKVPITILSRCQRYDFKKLNKIDLVNHLKSICEQEKIKYDDNALDEIYELSDGCARDALSILDQMSKSKEKITQETILKEYNIISNKSIEELITMISNNNAEGIINKINDYENNGMNAQKLIAKIINYLEKLAIDAKTKKKTIIDFGTINQLINELNRCYIDARINNNIFTMIKISFLEQIGEEPPPQTKQINKNCETTNITKDNKVTEEVNNQINKNISLKDIRINNCFVEPSKESLSELTETWNNIKEKKIDSLIVKDYKPVAASKTYAIFTAEEDSLTNLFNIKHDDIEKLLKKYKTDIKIVALTNEEWNKEKDKYKNKIKKKIQYQYIEEPKKINEGEIIKGQIENLFTEKLIEIS